MINGSGDETPTIKIQITFDLSGNWDLVLPPRFDLVAQGDLLTPIIDAINALGTGGVAACA